MSRRARSAAEPQSDVLISPKYLSPANAASRGEWQALYDVAVRFRNAAPWEWVEETQIFGVRNPENGEVGYCCIMGEMGEHCALAVYRGSIGLAGLQKIQAGDGPDGPFLDLMEALNAQDCLMASFEDRDEIEEPDEQVLKALRLRFRGSGAWPLFRSYAPGGIPWILTRPEVRFLTQALEQSLLVAHRLQQDQSLLPELVSPSGPFLVRIRESAPEEAGSGPWHDDLLMAEPIPQSEPPPTPLDAEAITRLRALPQVDVVVEMDMSQVPEPTQNEDGERPMFPYVLLVAQRPPKSKTAGRAAVTPGRRRVSGRQSRRRSSRAAEETGPLLFAEPAMPSDARKRFATVLAELVENTGSRPAQIAVPGQIAFDSLVRTAEALDIELLQQKTPSITAAQRELMGALGDLDDAEPDDSDSLAALMGLLD